MDPTQLRELIVNVLTCLNLIRYEDQREVELLLLTAAVESNLGQYIKQKGGGPARGIFQMEGSTERDIWDNYLEYKPELEAKVDLLSFLSPCSSVRDIECNLAYQIAMARIHYLRKPGALPPAYDVAGMAQYYKRHYNTYLGKGTVAKAIEKYHRYVR